MSHYCCPRCDEPLRTSATSALRLKCSNCQLGYHLVHRSAPQPMTIHPIHRTLPKPFVLYLTIGLALFFIFGASLTYLVAFQVAAPSHPINTVSSGSEPVSKPVPTKIDPARQLDGKKPASPPPNSVQDASGRDLFEKPVNDRKDLHSTVPNDNPIDSLVHAKLRENNIEPAILCSDAVFVRRVFIDVIGTLPTAEEARSFIKDTNPRKRQLLIDHLLNRKEYVDYWAMKWGDVLRIKSEFPINLWPNAARAYHHWVYACLRDNVPYDRMARELLTSSGSNFRVPAVNFYRAVQGREPQNIARTIALTFMGISPEAWSNQELQGFSAFFTQIGYKSTNEWKEEIVFYDERKSKPSEEGRLPDGSTVKLLNDRDPRLPFADWLVTPHNPWFTRTVANRVWTWLLGQGLLEESSDKAEAQQTHAALLSYLINELINAKYDLKHLYRIILNSHTYQASCIPTTSNAIPAAYYSRYPLRRMEAEVLIDAICQITGSTEKYSSPIPEPFSYFPAGHRAICLPDGSISSPFLELFGRPARDTGLVSERNNTITAAQRLHLLNSSHIQRAIERGPRLAALLNSRLPPGELADLIYLTIVSRFPTAEEAASLAQLLQKRSTDSRPVLDVVWSLINSSEFLFRH